MANNTTSTPLCPPVFSDPTCSGRGVCVADNTCQCPDGWTGASDFILGSPSCGVYIAAIQALYAIQAFVSLFLQAPIAFLALRIRYQKVPIFSSHMAHITAILNGIALGTGAILRSVRPTEPFGTDIYATYVWVVAWTFAILLGHYMALAFQSLIRMMLLGHTTVAAQYYLNRLRNIMIYGLCLLWLTSSLPLALMPAFTNQLAVFTALNMVWWLAGNAFSIGIVFGVIILGGMQPIITELMAMMHVAPPENIESIKDSLRKFRALRQSFAMSGAVTVLSGLLFTFVPILNRAGGSYHQPLIMINWASLVITFEATTLSSGEINALPRPYRWLATKMGTNTLSSTTQTLSSGRTHEEAPDNIQHVHGSVTNVSSLLEIIDDGNFARMEGATVSVVTTTSIPLNRNQVLIPNNIWTNSILTTVVGSPNVYRRRGFNILWSSFLGVILAMIVLKRVLIELGFLFSFATVVGSIFVFATAISIKVMKDHLVRTSYFWIVISLVVLNGVLTGLALYDYRASVVPGLMALQFMAFFTDPLVQPTLRSLLILNALIPTLLMVVFIVSDLAPDLHNEVLPIGSSGYSLLQSLRDALLAQVVQFGAELMLVWRGRDLHRFIHLQGPVELRLVTFEESRRHHPERRRTAQEGNASSVMLQSGFMMRLRSAHNNDEEPTTTTAAHDDDHVVASTRPTRVFLNKVAVKQSDCFAVHVFGSTYGEWFFHIVCSPAGIITSLLCTTGATIITIVVGLGYTSSSIALSIIPCLVIFLVIELSTKSRRLSWLLCRRIPFIAQTMFAVTWLIIAGIVLADERVMIALFAFTNCMLGLLDDAQTRPRPQTWYLRILHRWRGTGVVLVFSLYLLLDVLVLSDSVVAIGNTIDVIVANGTSSYVVSQAANAIDLGQQAGDWGLFYLTLPIMLSGIVTDIFVWAMRADHREFFSSISAPIAPDFQDGNNNKDVVAIAPDQIPTPEMLLTALLPGVAPQTISMAVGDFDIL